jgi:hypothetical protein
MIVNLVKCLYKLHTTVTRMSDGGIETKSLSRPANYGME